ncbi:hypothetical protein RRG08_037831 [Elysia crispata]|uniref:Uncharacterized protein n=1 Tax=Elysia crispata TaxID=231223 RepID=A0AAE0YUU5_9GAST|nr:hypothetical protein RRG08_037831 [Elysia crispata]
MLRYFFVLSLGDFPYVNISGLMTGTLRRLKARDNRVSDSCLTLDVMTWSKSALCVWRGLFRRSVQDGQGKLVKSSRRKDRIERLFGETEKWLGKEKIKLSCKIA